MWLALRWPVASRSENQARETGSWDGFHAATRRSSRLPQPSAFARGEKNRIRGALCSDWSALQYLSEAVRIFGAQGRAGKLIHRKVTAKFTVRVRLNPCAATWRTNAEARRARGARCPLRLS